MQLGVQVPREFLTDVSIGDSIAVNGTCLTVTKKFEDCFFVDVAKHSIMLTNLGSLKLHNRVNLERSMKYTGEITLDNLPSVRRFGGHFVQGHIDCVVRVDDVWIDSSSAKWYKFSFLDDKDKSNLSKYIVPQGYVTLDGVSLTVASMQEADDIFNFFVMLVPHTQSVVTNASRVVGDLLNLEVDILGKYAERLLSSQSNNISRPDGSIGK